MRAGGREIQPIKIIETSGKTLEMQLKQPAPAQMCAAKKCLARDQGEPSIGFLVNGVGYKLDCKHCLLDGRQSSYVGETGKNGHVRILNHQGKFRSKSIKVREESAFYKHIANSHQAKYSEGDELEQHFVFKILKVFKFPLDREVDEGVRMVMHEGQLINSKTEWFSPSIVRTTIEKGGVEMAYKPARGSYQASSRNHPPSDSQPVGMAEGSRQPPNIQPASQPASSQPVLSVLSAREERLKRRNITNGIN